MKRPVVVGLFCILALNGAWRSEAAAKKSYTCYRLAEPVVVDGKLDDRAWKRLPRAAGFFILPTPHYSAERQTEFRMGWDDKAVYLAIRCGEPAAAKLAALPPEKREGELLEIFFMPEHPTYFQLAPTINGKNAWGGKYRLRMQNKLGDLPYQEVKIATAIGVDSWTMEVAIPFSLFEVTPKDGTTWSFNIGRNSVLGRDSYEWLTTWAYLPRNNYHDYNEYVPLRFANGSPYETAATEETERINEAYFTTLDCRRDQMRRGAELRARLDAATSLTFTNGMRSSAGFDLNRPLWDEYRGMRYYGDLPASIEFTWPKPVTFNASRIIWFSPARMAEDYGLEFWDGKAWRLIFHEENNLVVQSDSLFEVITTDKVRLSVFGATPNYETLRVRTLDLFFLEQRGEPKEGGVK